MSYVDEVIAKVSEKNANEPEFLQTVEEVLSSLKPVVDKNEDVGGDASKSNSAIIHTGYDATPGSLESQLVVAANPMYDEICRDLDVPFKRIGAILPAITDEQFEKNYRTVLDAIKSRTNARILMIQPFLLETVDPAKQELCEELARKQAIVKQLADEYADAYLPLDEILHRETEEEPAYYAADGVHPTPDGACYIGEAYLGAIAPLIELLS